jgi:hypothetical protein
MPRSVRSWTMLTKCRRCRPSRSSFPDHQGVALAQCLEKRGQVGPVVLLSRSLVFVERSRVGAGRPKVRPAANLSSENRRPSRLACFRRARSGRAHPNLTSGPSDMGRLTRALSMGLPPWASRVATGDIAPFVPSGCHQFLMLWPVSTVLEPKDRACLGSGLSA